MKFIQDGGYRKIKINFENNTEQEKDKQILTELLKHCSPAIDEKAVEQRAIGMMEALDLRLSQESKSLEDFCNAENTTAVSIMNEFRVHARRQLSERAIIEEIADKERITVDEEELDKQLNNMLKIYPIKKDELLKAMGNSGLKKLKEDVRIRKTLDFLISEQLAKQQEKENRNDKRRKN